MPTTSDDPDKEASLADKFDGYEVGPLPPQVVAPPNMPVPAMQLVPPLPTPDMTPENHWCFRGPCRHFMVIKSLAPVDNAANGYLPEQLDRYCRAIPGVNLEMGDALVFECSDWAPKQKDGLEAQRTAYMKAHKSCGEADAARKIARETAIERMQAAADEQRARDTEAFERAKTNAQKAIDADEWAGSAPAPTTITEEA